jgi:predicted DNA-binding transcriptional regulator AlpA
MKPEIEIKPSLLTPDMVALMWCVSVKTVYRLINEGALPYVSLPSNGKRKRLIRLRAAIVEHWIEQHEVGGAQNQPLKTPRRRRRSILQPVNGALSLNSLKNEGNSQNETTENP